MRMRPSLYWVASFTLVVCAGPAFGGDGVVALQTAAPSCADDSGNRYVNCRNGTVTDNETGLVWLRNANCIGWATWHRAMEFVAGLSDLPGNDPDDCGLFDGSSPGEWRLPSKAEWEAMIEYADEVLGCSPTITSDGGTRCWNDVCPRWDPCSFAHVRQAWYWASSSSVASPGSAWYVGLHDGILGYDEKDTASYVWPVRGGQ